jgi:formate hydrogenlyase subunit 4
LQSKRGPSIFQPYYDILKFFRKDELRPEASGWLFGVAPLVAFACYLTVATLIPVLTTFPLPLGWMGDILGGAFLLGLAGSALALAGLDSGSPYAGIGSSRAITVSALTEPALIFVFFTVALLTRTDLPCAMGGHGILLRHPGLPAQSPARGGSPLHDDPGRHRTYPHRERLVHAGVRHDRRGACL